MTTTKKDKLFFVDISWYLLGAIIPMALNLIKTPVFTRHYTTEDFGYLGLVMTGFGYLSTVSFAWLGSCMWRYYNSFHKKGMIGKLYSNILFLYVLSIILTLIVSIIFIVYSNFKNYNPIVNQLIVLAFVHFSTKELIGLFMIIVRIKGFAKVYNLILIFQVALAFMLLLWLAFGFEMQVTSMILSSIVIDVFLIFTLFIYLIKTDKMKLISSKWVEKRIIKILFNYGAVTLIASIFLLLIVSSDRFIVAMYDTVSNVGIYTRIYDIAQLSIAALAFVYFSTVNPLMIKELTYNFKNADELLSKYLYGFILLGLPITFLASIYSKEVSDVLLGEDFRSGHVIMPFVFFSAFIYGMVKIFENKLKFASKVKYVAYIFAACFVFNLILNFLLIPKFGYQGAAWSTLATYIFMMLCFMRMDSLSFFKQKKYLKTIISSTLLLILFWTIHIELNKKYDFKLIHSIAEAFVFVIIFVGIFYKKIKNLDIPIR